MYPNYLISAHDTQFYVEDDYLRHRPIKEAVGKVGNLIFQVSSKGILFCVENTKKYIQHIDKNGKVEMSEKESFFDIRRNNDGSISVEIDDLYLSARPSGNFTLVPRFAIWEHFFDMNEFFGEAPFNEYKNKAKECMLAIGCGNVNYGENWFCTDLNQHPLNKVHRLDVLKKWYFNDNTFSYIYSEHVLQSFDYESLLFVLSEVRRVLKPEGVFRFAVPSLDRWINYYVFDNDLHDDCTRIAMDSLSKKTQDAVISKALVFNNSLRNQENKLFLDYRTYKEILLKVGFRNICQEQLYCSRHLSLNNMEHRKGKYNVMETLVIEAMK